MTFALTFLFWTFTIYWMHRLAHTWSFMRKFHADHHKQVTQQTITGWSWKNLFLWFDSWESTVDQFLTEVLPTIIISVVTGQWYILLFYYIWAAFIQEAIEHNEKINLYPLITSGRWHLIHHKNPTKNYGVFFPIWDILFGTKENLNEHTSKLVQE